MIADTNNNLLAIKKVSIKKIVKLKLQIDVPEQLKRTKLHVYLMADSYIGLDQAVEITLTNWSAYLYLYKSIYYIYFVYKLFYKY